MDIGKSLIEGDAPRRPALATLIGAMEKLRRCQRLEIAHMGRRAKAAKAPRIRRLAREANAEARRLAREAAQ
jgi:hypothetical protein